MVSRLGLDSGHRPDTTWRARLLSRSDVMTIARHFNAGLNPQESQVPQGRPNNCHIAHDDHVNGNEFQPSRWDSCRRVQWWPCASTVETPGYCRVVPLGRWMRSGESQSRMMRLKISGSTNKPCQRKRMAALAPMHRWAIIYG